MEDNQDRRHPYDAAAARDHSDDYDCNNLFLQVEPVGRHPQQPGQLDHTWNLVAVDNSCHHSMGPFHMLIYVFSHKEKLMTSRQAMDN